MDAIHRTQIVQEDGKITITDLPVIRGQTVQVFVFAGKKQAMRKRKTIAEILEMPAIGMWADRDDIGDGVEFARSLREAAQTRFFASEGQT